MALIDFLKQNDLVVSNAVKDIEEVYFMNDLPWVIGYSGGKDSTCTTQIIIDTMIKLHNSGKQLKKHIYIISSDTLVENPMIVGTIHRTIDAINDLSRLYDLPISAHIIRPEYNNSFWANLIGRGYPSPNQTFRWCTDRMKINPANQFITNIVDEYGEAVMVLGVRDGESESRDRVLESHTIEGRKLMRHTTMANAYVFAPIRHFSIENVWNYLLNNKSPWGNDNRELYNMYKDSSEDCPLIMDEETKQNVTCGNSRFGCWVCTVVTKDKSLTSFINKGEEWLKPLLEYRNWIFSIRDEEACRMRRRQDGSIYFARVSCVSNEEIIIPQKGHRKKLIIKKNGNKWIDNEGTEWNVFEGNTSEADAKRYIVVNGINLDNGENPRILIKKINDEFAQLGPGPFTQKTREEMLRRLLKLQKAIGDRYCLIRKEELLEIRKLWFNYGVWNDAVSKIYFEVFKTELDLVSDDIVLFNENDLNILSELCTSSGINNNLIKELFNIEKRYMGYNNRQEVSKNMKRLLSQEMLHLKKMGDINED